MPGIWIVRNARGEYYGTFYDYVTAYEVAQNIRGYIEER